MASNPATVSDIEARWRPLSAAEQAVASTLLGDAWQILLSRVSLLSQRLDDTEVSEDLVVAVLSAMVIRVLRNPDGKFQESIDDYSWTRDSAVSSGLLYVTDEELAMLAPAGATSSAFSIEPYRDTDTSAYPLNRWELNL